MLRAELARLRESEERLSWIVENSTNLFYSHTPQHELTYLSPRTREFLDCEPAEAMVHWTEFATDNPANALGFATTVRAINTGKPQPPYRLELSGRKGRKVWVQVRETPVVRDGKVVAMVGSLTDVTALHDAEEELQRSQALIEELRTTSRTKSQFMSNAAHELFTPLTPLRIQLHLLLNGSAGTFTPEQANALAILDRSLDRLTRLVQDVLDSARLQSHGLRLERMPCDLSQLAAAAVQDFKSSAERAGITLDSRLAESAKVDGDARRLTQVIVNLVSNALKYTPRGGTVTVQTHVANGLAIFRVTDTGPGLAPDQIERLFQPFTQLHGGNAANSSGLGLYVSHGLIALHGGQLWCESAGPDHGSTFVFSLASAPN